MAQNNYFQSKWVCGTDLHKTDPPQMQMFINTLKLQVAQVSYTSNTEVIKYMGKSLSSMQVSAQENMI